MRPRTYQQLACELALAAPLGISALEVHSNLKARGFGLSVSMAAKALRRLTAAGEVVRVKVEGRVRFCSHANASATLEQMVSERREKDREKKRKKRERQKLANERNAAEQEQDDRPFVHRWIRHRPLDLHQLQAALPSVWHLAARD